MLEPHLRNTIIVGRAEVQLRRLPAASIPLFIFSPPYNLDRQADGRLLSGSSCGITRGVRIRAQEAKAAGHYADVAAYGKRGGAGKWRNGTAYDVHNDAMDWEEYRDWQHDILRACWRCLTDDGAIFYVHKPRVQNGTCILPTVYNPGLPLRQEIIWRRAGGVNMAPTHYMPVHERVLIIAKPAFRLRSKGASGVGDVWDIPQEPNTWHPAPFPHALVGRILETVRRPDLVCDPFMGSGTTGRVAREWGIDYLGIEKSEAYAERARREIAASEGRDLTPLDELGPLFNYTPEAA
jgi:site-specific DNA-methyltransferase (adenine-specific)